MAHVQLVRDDFELTKDVSAVVTMDVDYEWEPFDPGSRDEPPSGGFADYWSLTVKSALLYSDDGTESVADADDLKLLQFIMENDTKINDWVMERLQEEGGPEDDPDLERDRLLDI